MAKKQTKAGPITIKRRCPRCNEFKVMAKNGITCQDCAKPRGRRLAHLSPPAPPPEPIATPLIVDDEPTEEPDEAVVELPAIDEALVTLRKDKMALAPLSVAGELPSFSELRAALSLTTAVAIIEPMLDDQMLAELSFDELMKILQASASTSRAYRLTERWAEAIASSYDDWLSLKRATKDPALKERAHAKLFETAERYDDWAHLYYSDATPTEAQRELALQRMLGQLTTLETWLEQLGRWNSWRTDEEVLTVRLYRALLGEASRFIVSLTDWQQTWQATYGWVYRGDQARQNLIVRLANLPGTVEDLIGVGAVLKGIGRPYYDEGSWQTALEELERLAERRTTTVEEALAILHQFGSREPFGQQLIKRLRALYQPTP